MFQSWVGLYDWVQEHQGDILRQAERDRAVETVRRRRREAASRAALVRARAGCIEEENGAEQADGAPGAGRRAAHGDCAEKRPA